MVSEQSSAQWTGKSCSLRSFGEVTASVLGAEMDCGFFPPRLSLRAMGKLRVRQQVACFL